MVSLKFLAICTSVIVLAAQEAEAQLDVPRSDMHPCSFNSYECDTKHTSNEVFQKILHRYGENNTLHDSQVYKFLYDVVAPFGSNSSLSCCAQRMFVQNGFGTKTEVDYKAFLMLCPAMLQVINTTLKTSEPKEKASDEIPPLATVWGYGMLSVTVISLCSLVGISILPVMHKKFYNKVLLYLISLAVGTLSSNAMFQLIPEGFGIENDSMTVWCSAVIFAGFYMFYLFENVLERMFKVRHDHSNPDVLGYIPEGTSEASKETVFGKNPKPMSHGDHQSSEKLLNTIDGKVACVCEDVRVKVETKSVDESNSSCCWIFNNYKKIKTVAWMITIADGLHNFIDGLAIGASFSQSVVQGISTSIAIFCEEFPHELGDFAILLSAGMSGKQAAFYNFASACCCYIGLCVGILVGHDVVAARWIFAIAGGVFLYISLTGMLPEAQLQASSNELKRSPWTTLLIQNAGILSGFLVMFLLTVYKDKIVLKSM